MDEQKTLRAENIERMMITGETEKSVMTPFIVIVSTFTVSTIKSAR